MEEAEAALVEVQLLVQRPPLWVELAPVLVVARVLQTAHELFLSETVFVAAAVSLYSLLVLVAPVAATVWVPQVRAAPAHETEAAVAFPTAEAAAPSPMPLLLVLAEVLAEVLAPMGEPYAILEVP